MTLFRSVIGVADVVACGGDVEVCDDVVKGCDVDDSSLIFEQKSRERVVDNRGTKSEQNY